MNSEQSIHQINLSFEGKPSPSLVHFTWDNAGDVKVEKGLNYSIAIKRLRESEEDDLSHIWYLNFPLGISEVQMGALGYEKDWQGFIRWLASFNTAREWRRECRAKIRKEPKRLTDKVQNINLSPTNLRRFKATWAGLKHLIGPMLEIPELIFLPQQFVSWKEKQAAGNKSVVILEGSFDPSKMTREGLDSDSLGNLVDEHPQVLSEGWIFNSQSTSF